MYSLSPFNLTQVVHAGTRQNCSGVSLLDLIFVSVAYFLYNCFVLSPLGNSDHCSLQLLVQMKRSRKKDGKRVFLWKYSQGDYDRARFLIDELAPYQ